ncbi:glycosyltransferase family 4 protein [Marinobacter lacisalsi]|uniref:Glycosyltransferase family 4 protein n=1 Tax=Marinobacter lacisalsi TaxID=475979 RepID=A0ABV8QG47_9GAMM
MTVNETPLPAIRVLHVTFNMAFGGTEAVIRELTAWDDGGRIHHQVVCIDGIVGAIGEQLRERGTKVDSVLRRPGFDTRLIGSLRAMIRAEHIDIVHCHQYTPWVYGCLASIGTSARVVFTEHGRFHPDRYRYKAIIINRILAAMTRQIVAISAATREALVRYEFLPRRRIDVIYNGINALEVDEQEVWQLRDELDLSPDLFVLGTVARLDPVKNQAMMLEAFAKVNRRHPDTRLVIVGDGPERESLEQKASALGIKDVVIFTGFSTTPGLYLALMDLFLLSSDTEGTSMTLLEAMSLGLPVVATGAGGTPEIVEHGVTGLLTPVGDRDAFAGSIEILLANPDQIEEKGQAGRAKFVQQYSVESMAVEYMDRYLRTLARPLLPKRGANV